MTTPKVSVLIRTKNEERYLRSVLEMLRKQTFRDFETIIVDDHSTDATLTIANEYGCSIATIPKGTFTHPFSCNFAAEKARGQYLIYLNGHSVPISNTWIEDGLKNFSDQKVAGVYATPLANQDANRFEKFLYALVNVFRRKRFEITNVNDAGMGIMGTTNAAIRRDLWLRYKFNEAFEMGGEDGDWAKYWIAKGYRVVHDPKFKVYHSHNLGLAGHLKQYLSWRKMGRPNRFMAQVNRFKDR